MRIFEDFTGIAIGASRAMAGQVSVCPCCGRSGVRGSLPDGAAEFVHAETEELFGDGMLVLPVDSCRLDSAGESGRRVR